MFKFLLIWRYLIGKRVALSATGAVTLVVMLVLVVLSVMSGLLRDTLDRNHHWSGDVIITRASLVGFPYYEDFIGILEEQPEVAAATALINTMGLQGSQGRAIQLLGIDFTAFTKVTQWRQTLHYLNFSPENREAERLILDIFSDPNEPVCVVGRYLLGYQDVDDRDRHDLREQNLGWSVTIFPISSRGVILGTGLGERQSFKYLDDSKTGIPRIDATCLYADFKFLQRLLMMDGTDGSAARANEIRVRLADGVDWQTGQTRIAALWKQFQAKQTDAAAARLLEDVTVQTWQTYRREAIAPAQKEKNLMVLVFAMIGTVVVFVVFAIFYLIVTEKIKDLGVIKSVGASGWGVSQIFLGYGMVVGMLGGLLGTLAGTLIVQNSNEIEAGIRKLLRGLNTVFAERGWSWRFQDFYIWDPNVYAIEKIPDTVDWQQAGFIFLAAIVAAVLGAALPARRAARLEVVETLQVT